MQDDYAFSQVWPLINTIDWDGPAFSVEKSYCLALFSELSYYHITKMETNETRRIKVVPCGAYQTILREGLVVDITTMLRPLDVPEPIIIEGRYTVIFVIPLRNIVIVAIRGTARAYDWLYNLNALPSKRHGLVFHRGFLKEALNQLPDLVTAIESLGGNAEHVYFTGYSLGGAVASVCYAVLTVPAGYQTVLTT